MVTIEVTQQDIDAGREAEKMHRPRTQSCPLAQAFHRAGYEYARVTGGDVCSGAVDKSHWDVRLPEEAQEFVLTYDRGEDVEPFSFEIDIPGPEETINTGA